MTFVARLLGLLGLLVACLAVVATAANTVPGSSLGSASQAITPDTLKPAACAGITLTTLVIGSTGGAGNDLVLGSAAVDTMDGNGGNDCVIGGGSNDSLRGSAGTDVCIGGPGTDTFHVSCETQIQ
jgi:Ca2+-binding RTX toxin-like protein